MFFKNEETAVKNCKQWFVDCGVCDKPDDRGEDKWRKFLEVHLLQDFVVNFHGDEKSRESPENLQPISFKASTPGELVSVGETDRKNSETKIDYSPMPQIRENLEGEGKFVEFENFFSTANHCIQKRSKRIYEEIVEAE